MQLFINTVLNSIVEILLFSLIPFIWWFVTDRKKESFWVWIGLKRIPSGDIKKTLIATGVTTLFFALITFFIQWVTADLETATSSFLGKGIAAVPAILVYGIFNTGLPEEIIFRGFILKRVASKFGYLAGNIVQSVLFGLLHGVMFYSIASLWQTIFITLATGFIAFVMGYVNEKDAGGSILPSWFIHAAVNVFTGLKAAFLF